MGRNCSSRDNGRGCVMLMFIAGHGHEFHRSKNFVKWMRKHKVNFLVTFAYVDMARLQFARKERKRIRNERKQNDTRNT